MYRCDGRVAIVSGASRGLGESIARRLAQAGARVALAARTLEPHPDRSGSLVETVESIRAEGGDAIAVRCDLTSAEDREELVARTERDLGPVDILVNNAAVTYLLPLEEFTRKRFDLMVETQLWAPFELTQRVVPSMKERGEGWILNITSRAAVHASGPPFDEVQTMGFSVYGTVKAGLDRMSNALAAELNGHGIAVNSLAPWDNVATEGAGHHDLIDGFGLEGPEWIAEAALVLCSTPAAQITGNVLYSQPFLNGLKLRPPTG